MLGWKMFTEYQEMICELMYISQMLIGKLSISYYNQFHLFYIILAVFDIPYSIIMTYHRPIGINIDSLRFSMFTIHLTLITCLINYLNLALIKRQLKIMLKRKTLLIKRMRKLTAAPKKIINHINHIHTHIIICKKPK